MKALILAAGYATRLFPLTKEFPKSLLKVNRRPIIDYILEKLNSIDGLTEVIVVTNSKFISQFRSWKSKIKAKKRLSLVDDLTEDNATRLGAVGDMVFAINAKKIKEDLIVIGGDNLFNGNLDDFLLFSARHKDNPVIGAFDIKNRIEATKYGVIKLRGDNKIIDFQEKPKKPRSTIVAMCLYYFPKKRLSLIKDYLMDKKKKSDATGFYIDWLRKKVPVFGFVFRGSWYDIGDHKFYNKAKSSFVR